MKKSIYALAACGALLTACGTVAYTPVVSDYNGDSVHIQVPGTVTFETAQKQEEVKASAQAEAETICRRGHRKGAEFASMRVIPTGQYTSVVDFLFLCLS